MNKSVDEFYNSLEKIVDFENNFQFSPNKPFIGEKYLYSFCIRKRGKAANREVTGWFFLFENYGVLKVRISLSMFPIMFLLFVFFVTTTGIVSLSFYHKHFEILIFLGFFWLMILFPLLILLEMLKSLGREVESKFKKIV